MELDRAREQLHACVKWDLVDRDFFFFFQLCAPIFPLPIGQLFFRFLVTTEINLMRIYAILKKIIIIKIIILWIGKIKKKRLKRSFFFFPLPYIIF